jgi:hypothetical protein
VLEHHPHAAIVEVWNRASGRADRVEAARPGETWPLADRPTRGHVVDRVGCDCQLCSQ